MPLLICRPLLLLLLLLLLSLFLLLPMLQAAVNGSFKHLI
jgi:hypothetical protein